MENKCNICSFSEIKKLQVIDLSNGKNYGYVKDAEIELLMGKIITLIIPKKGGIFSIFNRNAHQTIKIPYSNIERIGNDTILIRGIGE